MATIFETGITSFIDTTQLDNGNVFIVYRDQGDSGKGKFVIYTPGTEAEVVSPTVFYNGSCEAIKVAKFGDSKVLIAYRDRDSSNDGTFVIYTQAGVESVSATVFDSSLTGTQVNDIALINLDNGNIMIVYKGGSGYGTIKTYNSSGSEIVGATVFNSADSRQISVDKLSNNNLFITFFSVDGGYFVIYDEDGAEIKAVTSWKSGLSNAYTATASFGNGKVLLAGGRGVLAIYNNDGTVSVAATVVSTQWWYIDAIGLEENDVAVIYRDVGNNSYGTTRRYDSTLTLVKSHVFVTTNTYYPSSVEYEANRILTSYNDFSNSQQGTLTIYTLALIFPATGPDISSVRRLVAAANSKIWYESI